MVAGVEFRISHPMAWWVNHSPKALVPIHRFEIHWLFQQAL